MHVEFHKTGERRYAVIIRRENQPDLIMDPAPGFDPLMPHDMLHFLVEQELKLRSGIFGQIAAGGTAGTFHQIPSEQSNTRADSRQRRKINKRGNKLLKDHSGDCARSERATYVCLADWLAHSQDAKLRDRSEEMKPTVVSIMGQITEAERNTFDQKKLTETRARMDELSNRWAVLEVNQFISLKWKN